MSFAIGDPRPRFRKGRRRGLRYLATTAVARILRALRVHPRLLGYRHLPVRDLLSHSRRRQGAGTPITTLHEGDFNGAPLPRNLSSVTELPTVRGRWRRSFAEIPTRPRSPVYLVSIGKCRILRAPDQWNLEHFAVVTEDMHRISVLGTKWLQGHGNLLKRNPQTATFDGILWPWESWYSNYFHWLIRILPKLRAAVDLGLHHQLVVPDCILESDVRRQSALAIGLDLRDIPRIEAPALSARTATFFHAPDLSSRWIQALRAAAWHGKPAAPFRKLYISRSRAGRRKISNEAALLRLLDGLGYETIVPDQLTFTQQVQCFSEASVVLGPHGAGLANILFAPPPARVVEIADAAFPNPEYYDLATACGHDYWVQFARHHGTFRPGYHDLEVDLRGLETILHEVADELARSQSGTRR